MPGSAFIIRAVDSRRSVALHFDVDHHSEVLAISRWRHSEGMSPVASHSPWTMNWEGRAPS
jgi:hypothetical protein